MVKNVNRKDDNLSIWHIGKIVYVIDVQLLFMKETNLILRNRDLQAKTLLFLSRLVKY